LENLFIIKELWYAGVDGIICKAVLKAASIGVLPRDKLGLEIRVKNADSELSNEVKRLGYLKDRETPL
jgi:hypothetical protein